MARNQTLDKIKIFITNLLSHHDENEHLRITKTSKEIQSLVLPSTKQFLCEDVLKLVMEFYANDSMELSSTRVISKQFCLAHDMYHKDRIVLMEKNSKLYSSVYSRRATKFMEICHQVVSLDICISFLANELVAITNLINQSDKLQSISIASNAIWIDTENQSSSKELIKSITALGKRLKAFKTNNLLVLKLPQFIMQSQTFALLKTAIKNNSQLQTLHIEFPFIKNVTRQHMNLLHEISNLKFLKSLTIDNLDFNEKVMNALIFTNKSSQFGLLEELALLDCSHFAELGIVLFPKTPNMKKLKIRRSGYEDYFYFPTSKEFNKQIGLLEKLESLDLSECNDWNMQVGSLLESLSQLKFLNSLNFGCIPISEEKMPYIHRMIQKYESVKKFSLYFGNGKRGGVIH